MEKNFDIIVLGGGISGCAIFYELARAGIGRVALLEAREISSATTGDSGGYIRRFNTDAHLGRLASESFDYYQNFKEEVGGDCDFRRTGLTSRIAAENLDKVKAQIFDLQKSGHEILVTDQPPTASLKNGKYDGMDNFFIYEPGLGNIDTKLACRSWVNAACARGGSVFEHCAAAAISCNSGKVSGVVTNSGEFACDMLIVSAGAWSKQLIEKLPIEQQEITPRSFQYNIYPGAAANLDTAFMDNIEGFYTAPFRNGSVFAGVLGEDRLVEISNFDHESDEQSADRLHNIMAKHFTWIADSERYVIKRNYDAYTQDGRGVVKSFDEIAGLVVATGWSSGGIKSAPAIAREVVRTVRTKEAQCV